LCEQVVVNLDEMRRLELGRTARRIIVGIALAVVAAGVFLLWPSRTPVAESVPSPNGYDDLLKAAELISRDTFGLRDRSDAELRKTVEQNRAALELVRSALERECRVPVEYSTTYIRKHLGEMWGLKGLVMALLAEGRVAELDQRTNDAARCYLEAIHLCHEVARGGMQIDHITGVVFEANGSSKLTRIVPALDARACRLAIETLESMENKRESPDETLRIERQWFRIYGMKERISTMMSQKSLDPVKKGQEDYLAILNREIARQAQLRIDLARRAYELENGKPPAGLHVLVPAYLKSLPRVQPLSTNTSSGSRPNR
jgi:hypothetical protein